MEPFLIHNTVFQPGERGIVQVNIGRLPSDTRIGIHIHVYRSENPGPTLLVMGGVHGDEINGVEIVRRLIASGVFEKIKLGSVIAIPLLNIYGFINFSREVPDGKDVNRSFPGNTRGSLASRVARTVTKKVLPLVDFGVDFHTGGRSHYNYPQIRYSKKDAFAGELARAFAAPVLLAKQPISKTLRKVALEAGKTILVFEGGENLRFDGFSIDKGQQGLLRLMKSVEMIDWEVPSEVSRHFVHSTWLRAARAGLFRWSKQSGHAVQKGEPLGVINDPYGLDEIPVVANHDGFIVGHTNAPVVSTGDALFHIAY